MCKRLHPAFCAPLATHESTRTGCFSTLCNSVSVSGRLEAERLCTLKRLCLAAMSAQAIASDCVNLSASREPTHPKARPALISGRRCTSIRTLTRLLLGNNSREPPSPPFSCKDAVVICTLGTGTPFGESILDNTPRHATIVTREFTELLRIDQREFRALWEVSLSVCTPEVYQHNDNGMRSHKDVHYQSKVWTHNQMQYFFFIFQSFYIVGGY